MKRTLALILNHRQTEWERKYPAKEDEVDGLIIKDLMSVWMTK